MTKPILRDPMYRQRADPLPDRIHRLGQIIPHDVAISRSPQFIWGSGFPECLERRVLLRKVQKARKRIRRGISQFALSGQALQGFRKSCGCP